MQYKVFDISTYNNEQKFQDLFTEVYNDEGVFYESKETFIHREDGLNFDYKFCVNVLDIDAVTGQNTGEHSIELALVPTLNTLHKDKYQSLLKTCGIDEDEVETFGINSYDVFQYGLSVSFGYETIKHHGKPIDECAELQEKLNTIANVFQHMNSLRGFFLDKAQNRIGTTGWDLLNDYINGIDFTIPTLERIEKE